MMNYGLLGLALLLTPALFSHEGEGEFCAVAELEARVTILDKRGTPVAFLGDNPNKAQWAKFPVPAKSWKEGVFTAPHGLSYDADGNLYVQDWNATGRITKLVAVGE